MRFSQSMPAWRLYVVGAALLIVASNTATAFRPEWFVASTGRIPLFGGPLVALFFAVGLWFRLRAAYLLTIVGLAVWAWTAVERYRDGAFGIPAAYLGVAAAMLVALALLVVPRSVRREFFPGAA